jgi:hypothetical protein
MAPTVLYDDVVGILNATTSGVQPNRTLTFFKDSISEASVNAHIATASDYLHLLLGDPNWTSTDTITAGVVKRCVLFYSAALVLSVLSGGLIITGFNIAMSDLNLARSERFNVYHSLVSDFSGEAESFAHQLTLFALTKAGGRR